MVLREDDVITSVYRFVVLFLLVLILILVCAVSSTTLDRRGMEMAFLVFKIATGIAIVSFVVLCVVLLALKRPRKPKLDDPLDF
jgi:hypothetical protein